jgi:Cu/Ag efflux pump CusA
VHRGDVRTDCRRRYRSSLPGRRSSRTRASIACTLVCQPATVQREFLPEFLPELDEGDLFLHGEMVGGVSLTKASEMDADLRAAVREFPEVATSSTTSAATTMAPIPIPPRILRRSLSSIPTTRGQRGRPRQISLAA